VFVGFNKPFLIGSPLEQMRTDWMQEIRELEPALKEIRFLLVAKQQPELATT
jgi:hypothetical protein